MPDNVISIGAWAISPGPWSTLLVAFLDSAFIPLAQSVDVLIIAQAATVPSAAYLTAMGGVVGSTLGSLVLYSIARGGGRRWLKRAEKSPRFDRWRQRLQSHGVLALVPPTMLPIPLPMRPLVVAAGVFRVKRGRFVAAIALARSVRYLGLAFLTTRFGDQTWMLLHKYGFWIVSVLIAGTVVFVAMRRRVESKPSPLPLLKSVAERV